MKPCILLLLAIALHSAQSHAQNAAQPPLNLDSAGLTLREVMAHQEAVLEPNDTAEGGGLAKKRQAETFWTERVTRNSVAGANMFKEYGLAISRDWAAKSIGSACSTTRSA